MKTTIIIGGVVASVVGGTLALNYWNEPLEVTQVETVTEIVEVDSLERRIEDAQSAARTDIEAQADADYQREVQTALERKNEAVRAGLEAVADQVRAERITEIEAELSADASY
jgi:hypothetical protein